ncbi:DNA/RNA non-specific endonuclease [Bacillus paranthracis]|uniref:DNA/RNA non-specific endonuclease n=1 Tax=Bacillus cereus group TaxID=86661 RepID=UPI001F5958E8|nr:MULTISPECIES: DNA/RNA non-specific endonuclease [Bacillus cereus group]MCU5389909.1 DNA/RNA non-specific endonuclease [Bacillus paranthracis]
MLDRLSWEYYIIENTLAKGADSVTPFVKGIEILPDGSDARSGTNYSGKFQEAHDASKASIQSRISNLESGGVKGTGDTSKAVDDVVKDGSHFLDEFKLKPNVKYETNGYLYQTDELGRIERASGELTLEMGERNSKHQLAAGGEDRVKAPSTQGDHGGHLIGTQFNGSPLIDNIVAMNGNVNVSAYKKLESAWAKALRDKREVIVDIRPVYEGSSVRPVSFNIKYRIDGEKFKASLKNVYGGK